MSAEDTKRVFADAAAEEIRLHGYGGMSLSAVAGRVGLTKGALAHHYPTKAHFLNHFTRVLKATSAFSTEVARREYPESGIRQIMAHLFVQGYLRKTHPQVSAAFRLFIDPTAPTFEARDIVENWISLASGAIERHPAERAADTDVSPLEAAEMLYATSLGALFFGKHLRYLASGTKPLRFVRLSLAAVGYLNVNEHADAVIASMTPKLAALGAEFDERDIARITD